MRYGEEQVPCQNRGGGKLSNSFVFSDKGESAQRNSTTDSEAGGQPEPRWWFSANTTARVAPAPCRLSRGRPALGAAGDYLLPPFRGRRFRDCAPCQMVLMITLRPRTL